MRRVGVTATRDGLTRQQYDVIFNWLLSLLAAHGAAGLELHHGDCVGGDATVDAMCARLGIRRVAHPGPGPYRAWCSAEEVREPKGFLERDADIVDESDEVWGAPKKNTEPLTTRGSGTWWTIGYAETRRLTVIVWPDGRVTPRTR